MPSASATPTPRPPRKLYSGDDAGQMVYDLAARRATGALSAGESVPTGFSYFDDNNPPLMRGELMILQGLTSHGKTLAAATMLRATLDRLGNNASRAVLVVMTEESVEARRIQTWGDPQITMLNVLNGTAPLERIAENITHYSGEPVYFMGATTALDDVGTADGILRPSDIADGVNTLLSMGLEPELLIVDHVHDLEPGRHTRNEQERHDAVGDEMKQLCNALAAYCPVIALAQCNKGVEQRPPAQAIPNAYDIKFMQSLAARARDIFSVYYPQRHNAAGLDFKTVHGSVKAAKGMFLVHAAKARNGKCAGDTVAMTAMDERGNWSNQLHAMNGGF